MVNPCDARSEGRLLDSRGLMLPRMTRNGLSRDRIKDQIKHTIRLKNGRDKIFRDYELRTI